MCVCEKEGGRRGERGRSRDAEAHREADSPALTDGNGKVPIIFDRTEAVPMTQTLGKRLQNSI